MPDPTAPSLTIALRMASFLRATPVLQGNNDAAQTFRYGLRRKIIIQGFVIQWKIVVCLCHSLEELERQLLSALETYPEANKIVLVANGFETKDPHLATLKAFVPSKTAASVQIETSVEAVSPEQVMVAVWETLPDGAKVVAFCITTCEVRYYSILHRVYYVCVVFRIMNVCDIISPNITRSVIRVVLTMVFACFFLLRVGV